MIRAYVQLVLTLRDVKLIARQLLLDPSVLFAGYKVPHPLENDIVIKIQTDDRSNPADALKRACAALITQTLDVKQQFMDQAKNIDMGMGPEQGGLGGFDPYGGQAISGTAAAAGPRDDYDF
jgi:DNA-directed RNA polymerase II subunit RPB11